jgi:hypothetical protein
MNTVPSLGDYINMMKDIDQQGKDRLAAMQSPSAAFQKPEFGSQFSEGSGPSLGGPDVKELDKMPEVIGSMKEAGVDPGVELKTGIKGGSETEIGSDVGGAAIMAGASALKGILKANAEKEAIEFQKKREMTESQSKSQQKTAARGMGAGVQNMQQLIANFRSAAR